MSWIHDFIHASIRAAENSSFDPNIGARLSQHVGVWFSHLSENAAKHWLPNAIDIHECDFCNADAMTHCIACKARVCLAHAHVSYRAEAVCDECVQVLLKQTSPREHKEAPPPKRKRRAAREKQTPQTPPAVEAARKVLGVDPSTTWDEIKSTYRHQAREVHPDRLMNASATQQAAANMRLKRLNEAYAVLRDWYEKAA
jgi:hypothetical protein